MLLSLPNLGFMAGREWFTGCRRHSHSSQSENSLPSDGHEGEVQCGKGSELNITSAQKTTKKTVTMANTFEQVSLSLLSTGHQNHFVNHCVIMLMRMLISLKNTVNIP